MHSSEERMKRIRKLIRDNNQVEVCKAMVEVCKAMVVEVCKVMVAEVCKVMVVEACKVMVEVAMAVVKVEVIMAEVVECNHQTGLILEVSSNSHILMQDHRTQIK